MADISTPMSPADHVLCTAALALVLQRFPDPKETPMLLEVLAKEAAKASAQNPKVAKVAGAVEYLRAVADRGHPGEWAAAKGFLQDALQGWAMWRLGVALDVMRAGKAAA